MIREDFEPGDEVFGEDEIVCPHCFYEFSDSWEFGKEECGEEECPECGNEFTWTRVNDSGDQGRREFATMIADYFIGEMCELWGDRCAIEDRADWIWTEGDGNLDPVRKALIEAYSKSFGYARKIVAKAFTLTPETLAVIRERMGVSQ